MKQILVLYFKNLLSLSNKLYIFIFLVLSISLTFYFSYFDFSIQNSHKENTIKKLNELVNNYEKKDKSIDLLVSVASLEKYLEKNSIKIVDMKFFPKAFSINLKGTYKPTMKVIEIIEKKSSLFSVKNMSAVYDNDKKLLNLFLDINVLKEENLYKKTKYTNFVNVFDKNDDEKKIENKVLRKEYLPKLIAIVDNKVLIENKWLKVGENINKNKIVYIGRDYIKIKSNEKIVQIKIY